MISVCIPAYEMDGEGETFLAQALQSVERQDFTDHEIIVSDHSAGGALERLCRQFPKVRYLKNAERRGNSSANLNNALNHAKGAYIKILFQDDFLAVPWALDHMMARIEDKAWLVHAYWHTDSLGQTRFQPTQPSIPEQPQTLLFNNSIGAPSALMFKKNNLRFDENLIWYMDCEYYFRLLRQYGPPAILWEPLAVQTLWPGQLTHKITEDVHQREADYIQKKYRL